MSSKSVHSAFGSYSKSRRPWKFSPFDHTIHFKIQFREECRFDPGHPHHQLTFRGGLPRQRSPASPVIDELADEIPMKKHQSRLAPVSRDRH